MIILSMCPLKPVKEDSNYAIMKNVDNKFILTLKFVTSATQAESLTTIDLKIIDGKYYIGDHKKELEL